MTTSETRSERISPLGYIFAALATLIWSGNFVVARGVVDTFPPVSLALFRWGVAVLIILPLTAPRLWRVRSIARKNLLYFAVVGFLGVTLFNTIVYISGHTTDTTNLSLIASSSPIFLIILSRIFLGERITISRLLGVSIAVLGLMILITEGKLKVLLGLSFNRGDLYMIIASMVFAVYSILVRKKPDGVDQLTFIAVFFVIGFLMLIPWAMFEWTYIGVPEVDLSLALVFLYLGLGNSILAFLFWNKSLATIGPARTGLVYYTLPLFSGLEAYLILGEGVLYSDIVGGILIIVGIIIGKR